MYLPRKDINAIFENFYCYNKNPKSELNYSNDFTFLIAVILSARATDVSVNKATNKLFNLYKTPLEFLQLGEENLKTYINNIGLYNSKSKNIISTSKILYESYNSTVPGDFDKLIQLPGVGRKTANVILNGLFNKKTIAVDTHVYRVGKRLGLATANSAELVEKELMKNIPDKWIKKAHHWLVLHGRYICKSRHPLCTKCIIVKYCRYYKINFCK